MKYHIILAGQSNPVIVEAASASITDGCIILLGQSGDVIYAVAKGGWTFIALESAVAV